MCSDPKCAETLQQELIKEGIFFQIDTQARDLGISYTASMITSTQSLNTRLNSSQGRIEKIEQIAQVSHNAKKIV